MKILRIFLFSILTSNIVHSSDLLIKVKNLKSSKGKIQIALWDNASGFPDSHATAIERVTINANSNLEAQITNLKPGRYAVGLFHDKNSDMELNTNFMGIPKEGFGFSNNPKILFGPPNFQTSSFMVNKDQKKSIIIELKHF